MLATSWRAVSFVVTRQTRATGTSCAVYSCQTSYDFRRDPENSPGEGAISSRRGGEGKRWRRRAFE